MSASARTAAGQFVGEIELNGRDPDFDIRISCVAEHLPDPPDSPAGSPRITLYLSQDHLVVPDLNFAPGRHQKSVLNPRVYGEHKTDAVFQPVASDDQPVRSLLNPDHAAFRSSGTD